MNKAFVLLYCWLGCSPLCFAQADGVTDPGPTDAPPVPPLQFSVSLSGTNQIPANRSRCKGAGAFTLSGNLLSYDVGLPFPNLTPTAAGIYGPATNGTNGDLIFAWTNYIIVPGTPASTFRGAWQYKGSYTLTADQVDQLQAGLWYVNIKSADFPDGELRGQISLPTPDAGPDNPASPVNLPKPIIVPGSTPSETPEEATPSR
jgi:hypothetical protein